MLLEQSWIILKVKGFWRSHTAAGLNHSCSTQERCSKFCICGDYKVTVNLALDVDQYPLPKPEDLFATLEVGQKFSKLDLLQAYQQLSLENSQRSTPPSRGCTNIWDCHSVLHRLQPFFKRPWIPYCRCTTCDLLQLMSWWQESMRQSTCRIWEKCCDIWNTMVWEPRNPSVSFLKPSVDYLWHHVDAQGLHTISASLMPLFKHQSLTISSNYGRS